MSITQELISNLIDDLTYLEHEAEALKYVIDSVPYSEAPANSRSIIHTLALIDFAQHHYYRVITEDVFIGKRPVNLNSHILPEEAFSKLEEKPTDIQKVLNKISKHRAAFLNLVNRMSIRDWEKEVSKGKEEIVLFNLINQMVKKERAMLKEIAELVLAYQTDKNFQREAGINK